MILHGGALVASTAVVEADVELADEVSVWWHAVLRGDDAAIRIGRRTNIQDFVMVHADPDIPLIVGADVTVGHHAVLHGRSIADRALIGIGAILLTESEIGEGAVVAAGAVVKEGMKVPPRALVAGVPASIRREITDEEYALAEWRAEKYWKTARERAGRTG
jgi:carbonic anhydrase/acetyltransferase-like protein (isoleucine patch superfamily)